MQENAQFLVIVIDKKSLFLKIGDFLKNYQKIS
jgi:hypothetical protein